MRVIFVAGAWGSGTTALAGALAKLGVSSFGPHFKSNDLLTPNTFELVPFRDVILRFVDEPTIAFRGDSDEEFVAALRAFAVALECEEYGKWLAGGPQVAFLKMPLATYCIPQLVKAFDPEIILVRRSLQEIEASCKRRRWPAYCGAQGAELLYEKALGDLERLERRYLEVLHTDLVHRTRETMDRVIEFGGLQELRSNLTAACKFVRAGRQSEDSERTPSEQVRPGSESGDRSTKETFAQDPKDTTTIVQRAISAHKIGDLETAADLYRSVLEVNPIHFDALHLLGVLLGQLGDLKQAELLISNAITINPRSAAAHSNLGKVLVQRKRYDEALRSCDESLALKPRDPAALVNRGDALGNLRRFTEAIECYETSLELQPRNAEVLKNLGAALQNLNRNEEAITQFDKALEIDPGYSHALHSRGVSLHRMGRNVEAIQDFQRLLELDPDHPYTRGDVLYLKMHCADWHDYDQQVTHLQQELAAGKRCATPFELQGVSYSEQELLRCAQIWAQSKYPLSKKPLWTGEPYTHDRIRIAYLSADFRDHVMARQTVELFETHCREQFEVTGISFGADDRSATRARLSRAFEHFVDVRGKSDRAIAELLREREIDIAVDLMGYTTHCRPGILAQRPVPAQVCYLGFPGTLGSPYIDYILADRVVIPENSKRHYSENVVYLPDSYQVNDGHQPIAEAIPGRKELGLPESAFVFCCFNNSYKITPPVFDVWMRLLLQVDDSVLWLVQGKGPVCDNLRGEASRRGVAPERLVFAPRVPLDEHFARHRQANLFLDTLPYNAHATGSIALRAGLPVLTCEGTTFPGRVGSSLLHAIGLPELVATSLEEYEALALTLARDPDRLTRIRDKLAANRDTHALFDCERFCRHLEDAYETMRQRSQDGQKPVSFAVRANCRSDKDSRVPGKGPKKHVPKTRVESSGNRKSTAKPIGQRGVKPNKGKGAKAGKSSRRVLQELRRAISLHEDDKFDQAEEIYRAILKKEPENFDAQHLLGVLTAQNGRYELAEAMIRGALKIKPKSIDAHTNLAQLLSDTYRRQKAVEVCDQALALDPNHTVALAKRGDALHRLRRHAESIATFERLLQVDPEAEYARGRMLRSRMHCADWNGLGEQLERIKMELSDGRNCITPFELLGLCDDLEALNRCSRLWADRMYPLSPSPLWSGERYHHDRIRVAYLSADFHSHATAYLMAELFERHDRDQFEVMAVSYGPDSKDDIRKRLVLAFEHFVDVRERGNREVASMLRKWEVDIAIDLKGYTANCRAGILANRPAPIQVNYLGFPGTMACDFIDYIIADPIVIPEDQQAFYSEKVIYLPDSYQVNDSKRLIARATPSRSDYGLPETGFVFCCFNNPYKILPEQFDIWMRLMKQVEGSVLWLFEGNDTVKGNLRQEARERGVSPDRLIFAPPLDLDVHLSRHRLADLFLDTLPYNAHTTASDALWAGLPIVTCLGKAFAGRVAASLLRAAELPELITTTPEEYEALALALAQDPERLATLKAKLAGNREHCPLFDTDRFRRHIEAAYKTMWQRHQDGLSPESFSV